MLPILSQSQQCLGRYENANAIFKNGYDTIRYHYVTAPDSRDTMIKLYLTVYKPKNDTARKRPLILIAAGGELSSTGQYISGRFMSYNRSSFEIIELIKYLTARGHVCATFDLRKEFKDTLYSQEKETKALFRGIQDMNMATLFLKSKWDSLRIDTNKFFIGGISTGALISNVRIFGDYYDYDSAHLSWMGQVGGLEPNPNNIEKDLFILGAFSFSGGVLSDSMLDGELPIYLNHARWDTIMPYHSGVPWAGNSFLNIIGSGGIKNIIDTTGVGSYVLDSSDNAYHPNISYIYALEDAKRGLTDYLYYRLSCDQASISNLVQDNIHIYPNPTSDLLHIESPKRKNSIWIYDMVGKSILSHQGEQKTYDIRHIPEGIYSIRVNEQSFRFVKE